MRAIVKYQIATYSGEVSVNCETDAEEEQIIAKARNILRNREGHLPFGYQSLKIIKRISN